jgi:cysteine-rich repeat protein
LSIDGISVSGLPGFCGFCPDTVIQSGEQCDDGNTTPGDGCSATCQDEVCGNLFVDPGEECDDGNTTAGDGCSDVCLTEDPVLVPGFGVVGMLSLAMLLVGAGTVLVIRSRDGAARIGPNHT